jgi:hypothetical protein
MQIEEIVHIGQLRRVVLVPLTVEEGQPIRHGAAREAGWHARRIAVFSA